MKNNHQANGLAPQRVNRNGRQMVLLEETEFDRLLMMADEWEPPLPEPDADGCYPALEYSRISLARKIIRHRRRVGLTQQELARRAGIRLSSLTRIEQAQVMPSIRMIEKIERALENAEAKAAKTRNGKRG